jgi:penicillin amidase
MPAVTDPEAGFVVTANNRIAPDDFPHHVSSDYLDGHRAARIEQLIEDAEEHDLDGFARMQTDMLSLPGLRTARLLARLGGRDQREIRAIERLRSWDGRMTPESVAASIYQAFTMRFGIEVARAALGDRDLAERWLDRSDTGFTTHITTPWRWQSHLLGLWEEADSELIGGRDWGALALDCLRRALDDLGDEFGRDPEDWRWGLVHKMHFRHALGAANPLLGRLLNRELEAGGGQETVAQIACDPNDPYEAVWAPSWRMVIDMSKPEAARWQSFTGQSGHPGSPHYDDLQRRWLRGEMQPMAGEGPWETLRLVPESPTTPA